MSWLEVEPGSKVSWGPVPARGGRWGGLYGMMLTICLQGDQSGDRGVSCELSSGRINYRTYPEAVTTVSKPLTPKPPCAPIPIDPPGRSDMDGRSLDPFVAEEGPLVFFLPRPKMPPPFLETDPALAAG